MTDILCIGDLHSGSAAGLTPPPWQYKPRPPSGINGAEAALHGILERAQKILWRGFVEYERELGPVDIAVVNADLTDGSRFETIQHITTDAEQQADIAAEALSIIRFRGKPEWYFTYGTPSHTANGWNYEHRVADLLGGPIRDTMKLRIAGLNLQWRHQQGRSDIPTGQGAQLSKEVIRDILRSAIYDYPAADVLCRSHTHYWYHLGFAGKEAFSLPSLEVPISVFGRKLRTLWYDMGMLKMRISRGGILDYQIRLIPLRLVLDEQYHYTRGRGRAEK